MNNQHLVARLDLPRAGGDPRVENAIGIGRSDRKQAVGGLHRQYDAGQPKAGIGRVNHLAGNTGRGVGQDQVRRDGRAAAQSDNRRRRKIRQIIASESREHISPWRHLDGVAARIVCHCPRDGRTVRPRHQENNGIGQRRAGAIADDVAGDLLREGKIRDRKLVGERREMAHGAGQLEQIFPDDVLHEITILKIQLRGDGARRGIQIAGHIEIGHLANHKICPILQSELLHQPVSAVNDAVGVEIEKFLDDHRLHVRQPADRERDEAAVGVADGGRRVGESDRSQGTVSNEQPRRQRDQPPATFNDGFRRMNFGMHREFGFFI